jgi:hypothetical protein
MAILNRKTYFSIAMSTPRIFGPYSIPVVSRVVLRVLRSTPLPCLLRSYELPIYCMFSFPCHMPHDTPRNENSREAKDIAKDWTFVNMTMKDGFASTEDEHERITCLVEQGFTPCK